MKNYKVIVHERDVVCKFCGCEGSKGNPLTVHHVIPRCQHGPNTPENCILLCANCHRECHEESGYPNGKARSKRRKEKRHRRR